MGANMGVWRAIVAMWLRLRLMILNGSGNGIGHADIVLYLRWDSDVWIAGVRSIYRTYELNEYARLMLMRA